MGVRDGGRNYAENLDLILADIGAQAESLRCAHGVCGAGHWGQNQCATSWLKKPACAPSIFGSMLRALTYSGTPGHQAHPSSHCPYFFTVPLADYMQAWERTAPQAGALERLRKMHGQLGFDLLLESADGQFRDRLGHARFAGSVGRKPAPVPRGFRGIRTASAGFDPSRSASGRTLRFMAALHWGQWVRPAGDGLEAAGQAFKLKGGRAVSLPRISIVTPSFNQAQFVEQTICSVLDQGYPNPRVFRGRRCKGSTDGTVEILKKYEKHLTGWISEKDRGQTHAINKGFAKCGGDICAYPQQRRLVSARRAAGRWRTLRRAPADRPAARAAACARRRTGARRDVQFASIATAAEILDLWGVWWKGRQFVQPEVFWAPRAGAKGRPVQRVVAHGDADYEYWLRAILAGAQVASLDRSCEVCCFCLPRGAEIRHGPVRRRRVARGGASVSVGFRRAAAPAVERRRLQAMWLYDGPFRELADRSVAAGRAGLKRWPRLAGFVAGHPGVLRAEGVAGAGGEVIKPRIFSSDFQGG